MYPDFRYKGKLVEIKGNQFFNKKGEVWNPFKEKIDIEQLKVKFEVEKEQGVEFWFFYRIEPFLTYIKETYGADYLKQFRVQP